LVLSTLYNSDTGPQWFKFTLRLLAQRIKFLSLHIIGAHTKTREDIQKINARTRAVPHGIAIRILFHSAKFIGGSARGRREWAVRVTAAAHATGRAATARHYAGDHQSVQRE
jgi:hypothetical protein